MPAHRKLLRPIDQFRRPGLVDIAHRPDGTTTIDTSDRRWLMDTGEDCQSFYNVYVDPRLKEPHAGAC